MYNTLMKINMLNKILFLLIFSFIFILVRNTYVLALGIFILLVLSVFSKSFNAIDLLIIACVLFFYKDYYLILNILFRFLLVITTIIVFMAMLNKNQKRLMLEKLLYFNPRNGKRLISFFYRSNVKAYNKEKYVPFKSLLTPYWRYSIYMSDMLNLKTDNEVMDVYLSSRLRFYNYYRSRTSIRSVSWENIDNTVLMFNILIIVLAIIWRY